MKSSAPNFIVRWFPQGNRCRPCLAPPIPFRLYLCLFLFLLAPSPLRAQSVQKTDPTGIEFFEKKVRPVLADRCFKCHSAASEKLKGGLRLDSREGMLKGGDTRPAIAPGEPQKSLLVEAINYGNVDLQMPPKGMLPKEQIADLETWVRLGAPWPESRPATTKSGSNSVAPTTNTGPSKVFNLAERKKHWAWQPVRGSSPPAVTETNWPANDVDRFLLAKLEKNHLRPAPDADRRALIRRLAFDLTGLPPSPAELARFLADPDPRAWENLVDRFLAKPQFGERWARHWLDLARYAESMGHEFDFPIANVWQYRDYVIRAFNEDLPYDRFVLEQVAGDLLPPRVDSTAKVNEAVVATAFLCMAQQTHSPVDARQHQADLVDNQIDVLTKTFLGLTVSCARCHDHKFDAISTRDYYALYGILESSRLAIRAVDSGLEDKKAILALAEAKAGLRSVIAEIWASQLDHVETNLLALQRLLITDGASNHSGQVSFQLPAPEETNSIEKMSGLGADWPQIQKWLRAIRSAARSNPSHPVPPPDGAAPHSDTIFADGPGGGFRSWRMDGAALADNPVRPGDFVVGSETNAVADLPETGALHSALLSRRLEGVVRSPTFIIEKNYLHILAGGKGGRVNLVVDNFTLIRDPIYGSLKHSLDNDQPAWINIDVTRWKGQRAYLEFEDIRQPDPADPTSHANGYPRDAYFFVNAVVFSNDAHPRAASHPQPSESLDLVELANDDGPKQIRQSFDNLIRSWVKRDSRALESEPAAWRLWQWMLREHLLQSAPDSHSPPSLRDHFASAYASLRQAEGMVQSPRYIAAISEGNGLDETVFIRGSPRNPGTAVPRRFLEAIAGPDQPRISEGSGRLELARHLVDPSNPLTGRVMVNRVWSHLFGQGIVGSTDNFGVLGQAPTHPELLDWLAVWYRDQGWSTKKLIKLLVTSRAYRLSSHESDPAVESADPGDRWLHRMRVRRLEGESIRDAILSISGELDPTQFGPSIPVHLTPFMDGRGRPASSGPLDGARRRSIYLEVRRNFLDPFMLTYDTPAPFSTVGRRTDSNLPAQALILLNDPFVTGQAKAWAARVLAANSQDPVERVRQMYLTAFSRPPDAFENKAALDFLEVQAAALGLAPEARSRNDQLWTDFAHVLLNVNEFVYLE